MLAVQERDQTKKDGFFLFVAAELNNQTYPFSTIISALILCITQWHRLYIASSLNFTTGYRWTGPVSLLTLFDFSLKDLFPCFIKEQRSDRL